MLTDNHESREAYKKWLAGLKVGDVVIWEVNSGLAWRDKYEKVSLIIERITKARIFAGRYTFDRETGKEYPRNNYFRQIKASTPEIIAEIRLQNARKKLANLCEQLAKDTSKVPALTATDLIVRLEAAIKEISTPQPDQKG